MLRAVLLFSGLACAAVLSSGVASGKPLSEAEGTGEASAELLLARFIKCADEGHFCTFSGTQKIAYGANGIFVYITNTGGIPCNNETFGDPIVGVKKACYVVY